MTGGVATVDGPDVEDHPWIPPAKVTASILAASIAGVAAFLIVQPPQGPLTPIEATLAADGNSVATTLAGWHSVTPAMVQRTLPTTPPPHFSVSVVGGHDVTLTAPGIQSCLGVRVDVSSPRPQPQYAVWTPPGDSCDPMSSVPSSVSWSTSTSVWGG